MARRTTTAVLAFALLLGACNSELGRNLPDCESVSSSLILSVQAIQTADYVPCVSGLWTGWSYEDLEAKSGQSVFWLSSDRMGLRFLEVKLEPWCDISGARLVPSDEEGIPLFKRVAESITVPITVVPEGTNLATFSYADQVAADLKEETIEGRRPFVRVDAGPATTTRRIERARAAGDFVFVVSIRDAEEGTVTLILPESGEEIRDISLSVATDILQENTDPPSYRGSWYYPFGSACITYVFDAEGPGVDTIEADVQAALGVWPTETIRRLARDMGYSVP